jgi:hypothetical protein
MPRKWPVLFEEGPTEKGWTQHLAGGLLHSGEGEQSEETDRRKSARRGSPISQAPIVLIAVER